MLLLLYIHLQISSPVGAEEIVTASEAVVASSEAQDSSPPCVDDPQVVERIQQCLRDNRSNSHKYDGYKSALRTASDLELATRLAYAETLAANCHEQNQQISRPIVETIANRVSKRGDVRSVVFERDQFASSLNKYSRSRQRDFLCPKDMGLWNQVRAEMQRALSEGGGTRLLSRDSFHYYFFQHDTQFTPPGWAQGSHAYEVSEFSGSNAIATCVKFYRNPSWR